MQKVVAQAGAQIADGIRRSTVVTDHHPTSGSLREGGFREFLRQVLPDRYYIGTGFLFDALDVQSRQLDIVIAADPPLGRVFERDGICYLPCEVALAAIEVKHVLDASEVEKAATNAARIRSLRPYGDEVFTPPAKKGRPLPPKEHRCYYGLVASTSDLALENWAEREWNRFQRISLENGFESDVIDRFVILDRGVINCPHGVAHDGRERLDQVATEWFIQLLNHLEREAGRRRSFDPDVYWQGLPRLRLS